MLLGEGLFDPCSSGADQLVERPEVLRGAGGDERLSTGGSSHGDFFPGLAEGVELLVVGHARERFELASVDPPTGIVVLTPISELTRVEATNVF